jgi:hypothetical protein
MKYESDKQLLFKHMFNFEKSEFITTGLFVLFKQNKLHLAVNLLFNLLKPTGYVTNRFNIQQLYALSRRIYLFCIYLRTNSKFCHHITYTDWFLQSR